MLEKDIVLTTYATVAAEASRKGQNILGQIHWYRIVLDEAHEVRTRSTKQHQAAVTLTAEYRWCLTGTPIQNTVEDLGALVAFLRVPILDNHATFRKFIATPSASNSGDRFKNLRFLLNSICIRRSRDLLQLPEPATQIKVLDLTPAERQDYIAMNSKFRAEVDRAVSGHGKGNLSSTALKALLELRLFCNNGRSAAWSQNGRDADEILTDLQQQDQADCVYCGGAIYSINSSSDTDGGILIPNCYHLACRTCISRHHSDKKSCPRCAAGNTNDLAISQSNANTEDLDTLITLPPRYQFPSKILAFLQDVLAQPLRKR